MPFVSKKNIKSTADDVGRSLGKEPHEALPSLVEKEGGTSVSVQQNSTPEKEGVPVDASIEEKEVIESEGVILEKRTLTEEEARDYRLRRTSSIQWSMVVLVVGFSLVGLSLIGSVYWVGKGLLVRIDDIHGSAEAFSDFREGEEALRSADYERAAEAFRRAHTRLNGAEEAVGTVGRILSKTLSLLPGQGRRISSSERLLSAATSLSEAGTYISRALGVVRVSSSDTNDPLTDRLALAGNDLREAQRALQDVQRSLNGVDGASLSGSLASAFVVLEDKVPLLEELLGRFLDDRRFLLSLLGHDRPSSYLLLFQNTAERRATGGFIGTVALLELSQGEVTKLETFNVFDLDGQLINRIVPPRPIQKVSTAWSLHDSNWFFDFPMSAQKAAWFYEEAGGQTVDGVVAITPDVLIRFLSLLGDVELPDYGVTLTAENVLLRLQQQVETGYTQSLNRPKRIVGDLVPALQDSLSGADSEVQAGAGLVLLESLSDKSIMLWVSDETRQEWIADRGWSGEVYDTDSDYLAIVHSNINGYKTDAVIDDTVVHEVSVQSDGRIIDTVTVTRRHTGGNTGIEWWDQVNSDYLRVYVPMGSVLLGAEGHTPQRLEEAIDYEANDFTRDRDVLVVGDTFRIDEQTGTHIFEEGNKTVFANWVYVSPGRSVAVRYRYELPFYIESGQGYALTFQAQSGSHGGSFEGIVNVDSFYELEWLSDNLIHYDGGHRTSGDLGEDLVHGFVIK